MNMKNISLIFKMELMHQIYTRLILYIFIILIGISTLNTISLIAKIESNYNRYKHTEITYIQDGLNINEYLNIESAINKENNTVIIDNTLRYDFENLSYSINNIKPNNIVANMLEYSIFVFCTFIFGVYGVYIAVFDFKNNTIKSKMIMSDRSSIIIGKNLSAFLIIFLLLASVCLATYIFSFFIPLFINVDKYSIGYEFITYNYNNNILIQFLFSYAVLCLYFSIGFLFGIVVKNTIICVSILAIYGFLIPILGKYDLRNIISVLSHNIFAFNGNFTMFTPIYLSNHLSIIIFISLFILLLIFEVFIFKKQQNVC